MRFGAGETFWDRIEQELGEVPSESEAVGTLVPRSCGIRALPQDAAEASHFGDAERQAGTKAS